jgi:hypothetical protein
VIKKEKEKEKEKERIGYIVFSVFSLPNVEL